LGNRIFTLLKRTKFQFFKGKKVLVIPKVSLPNFELFSLFLPQMLPDDTRSKIKNIIAGALSKGQENNCTTIRNLLCVSYPTITTVKPDFESQSINKEEQARFIEKFISENDLWVTESLLF
jgi:hypothetical protein